MLIFKRHVVVTGIEDGRALLYALGNRYVVAGLPTDRLEGLLALLRQGTTRSTLGQFAAGDQEASAVQDILAQLEGYRLFRRDVGIADPSLPPAWRDLLDHFDDPGAAARIREASVFVRSERSSKLMESFDVGLRPRAASEAKNADLVIAVGRWSDAASWTEFNAEMLERQKPWCAVVFDEFGGLLSPIFGRPGDPCWQCLLGRRSANLKGTHPPEALTDHFARKALTEKEFVPAFEAQVNLAAAFEIVKFLGGFSFSSLNRGAYVFDHFNHRSEFHEILPLSSCGACGPHHRRPVRAWHSFLST